MNFHLICTSKPPTKLIEDEITRYSKQLGSHQLHRHYCPPLRGKNNAVAHIQRAETQQSLALCSKSALSVALDAKGQQYTSQSFAHQLERWLSSGRTLYFHIGGAFGFDAQQFNRFDSCWSLSTLTFPHTLVSLLVVEQLYRACSILSNHPYDK